MDYKDRDLNTYLEDLAAKLAAPGGGSAAAMSAAMGASLISMVVNFTVGKPRYSSYDADLRKMLNRCEKLREELTRLIDLDVVAYKSRNIRDALDVPLMVCRLSYEGMRLCPALIKKGNVNLISDVAVAAIMLEAAFTSAYFNVEINLKALKDERLSKAVRKELLHKEALVKKTRKLVEEKIGKVVRG